MAAPAAAPATNGAAASNGGGPGVAHANALLKAKTAWAQDVPNYYDELVAKMEATRQAYGAMAGQIQEHVNLLVQAGFHPMTCQPLMLAAASLAESANHYTGMVMACEQVYANILAHYRSGVPDPGEQFLSNGTRGPGKRP